MEKINFKLFSNYILLDPVKKNTLTLAIPETVKNTGDKDFYDLTVVLISEDKDEKGEPLVKSVKVGDRVLLNPYSAPMFIEFDKKKYLICRDAELIGVFIENNVELPN